MLSRRLKETLFTRSTLKNIVQQKSFISTKYFSKRCLVFDSFVALFCKFEFTNMSYVQVALKDISVKRILGSWIRSSVVNTVVKRCKCDRAMRGLIQRFRQSVFRPRKTLFLYAAAAYKSHSDDPENPTQCSQNITDEDLEALICELDGVEELSKQTLYCTGCGKRLIIDKKLSGVRYCACKDCVPPETSPDGWEPYMETDDVIIWRKEYKSGQGLYAYKVYGRYKEVLAHDFAAVQVDGAYRRVWDAAVASLSVVERTANGLQDQAVLHWEVLWPRLFANRDYVYIRRHKEFEVNTTSPISEKIFFPPPQEERPSVHSRAKRIAIENDMSARERWGGSRDDKVFIIISRSCEHPDVPETKHAIRVSEYWSHMVVKSTNGADQPGMEFVLTYYDEPAVGGLPSGVAAWATGRAAPAYLHSMRRAAADYARWRQQRDHLDIPDFVTRREKDRPDNIVCKFREQDMETSKQGPELDNGQETKPEEVTGTEAVSQSDLDKNSQPDSVKNSQSDSVKNNLSDSVKNDQSDSIKNDQSDSVKNAQFESTKDSQSVPSKITQCDTDKTTPVKESSRAEVSRSSSSSQVKESSKELITREGDNDKAEEEESKDSNSKEGSWWRYLYPFYYFV